MDKQIVERFLIGGSAHHPSIPSAALQKAIGTIIKVDIENRTLIVPTADGYVRAKIGDTVICYDDGTYGVEAKKEGAKQQ